MSCNSLGNQSELEKVFIIPHTATGGPLVRCADIIARGQFLQVDQLGYVLPFLGCPVHSPENNKIVGKSLQSKNFGEVILIDMQFNIRNKDCLCELEDIEV